MRAKIIKYFMLGITSAVLSWLPVNLLGIIEDTPKILGLIVILLPAITLGAFLFIVLNYQDSKLVKKPIINNITLVSFCSIGWVSAMVVSTVGVDFTFSSMSQSPYELFITGLPPSIIGILFTGIGIYICLKKPLLSSKYHILSIFIFASIVGLFVFSILSQYLVGPVGNLLSNITNTPSYSTRETSSILILFLSWHIALFLALPFITKEKRGQVNLPR